MNLSSKDKILAIIIIIAILFFFPLVNLRKSNENISNKKNALKNTESTIMFQEELIEAKDIWMEQYNNVKTQMPTFDSSVQVDTYWLNIMDLAAERHGIKIRNRDAGKEVKVKDVYEFPIIVKDWEGELEPLINFMHALQSEGAMLDIRTVNINAVANKPGLLKGSFELYCAYMRDNSVE